MRELRMSEREVHMLISTAPDRYKVYNIKKRNGGLREIAHPASELKIAQRAIVREYLENLPVHPCATAYRPGSSIRRNAELHSHNRPILKYDFRNFFPSITERAWLSYCAEYELLDRADAIRVGRILFRRPKGGRVLRLSIGAPSSPILSNILMNEFDREIYNKVSDHKITYTRYADDLTFSALRTGNLSVVDKILRSVINKITSPKLEINTEKTVLVTPKFHRQVTGLILTLDGRVSLGRERKRTIRSGVHHFIIGKLDLPAQAKLAGNLAFAKDVEPEFYTRMERVYGKDNLDKLKASVKGYKKPKPWKKD
jgi:hypothetical protein